MNPRFIFASLVLPALIQGYKECGDEVSICAKLQKYCQSSMMVMTMKNLCAESCGFCKKKDWCIDGDIKDDGCNTCVCENGRFACTEAYCPPTQVERCTEGHTKPAGDGCNTCICRGGRYGCTEKGCGYQNQGCIAMKCDIHQECWDDSGSAAAVCLCKTGYVQLGEVCKATCAEMNCTGMREVCYDKDGSAPGNCTCPPYHDRHGDDCIIQNPLRCPVSRPVMCIWFNQECLSDKECASGEWCCPTPHSCGTTCIKPEPRDGCPPVHDWGGCPFGQDLCRKDTDCGRSSCCPYSPSCGNICQ